MLQEPGFLQVIARVLKDQQYVTIIEVVLCEDSIARPQREWHDMTHQNEVWTGAAAMKWKHLKPHPFSFKASKQGEF